MNKNWVKNMLISTFENDTLSKTALLHYKTTHLFTILNRSYNQIAVLIINYNTIICV